MHKSVFYTGYENYINYVIAQKLLILILMLSVSDNQKAKSGAGSEIGGSGSAKERVRRGKSQ